MTVTGPDGQLTQVTFTTDHTGSTIARITWSDGSVPGGTTLSAALTGPGGESVPGVEQSLTTPEDEVVPTPEPIVPQPTATSTPGAAAPGDGPDAAAPGDGAAPEPARAAPEQAGPEQAGPAQEAEASSAQQWWGEQLPRTGVSNGGPWSSPAASSCWPVPAWWAGARCGVVADPEGPLRTRRTVSAEGRSTCGHRVLRPWAPPCLLS